MSEKHKELMGHALNNSHLVAYLTNTISPERNTGNTVRKGAKTTKETVTTFDEKLLNAVHAERQAGARLCQQYGTKVKALSAWLVHNDRVEELESKLDALRVRVHALREEIALKMPQEVERYALLKPEDADLIRNLGPTSQDVRDGIDILYVSFRLQPEQVNDRGGLSEEFKGMHVQVLHEFHMVLKDAKANPDGKFYTSSMCEILGRIAAKAKSLSFLHPVLEDISETVSDCLKTLPQQGRYDGFQAMAMGNLVAQLMDPIALMRNGGFTVQEAFVESPAEATTTIAMPTLVIPPQSLIIPAAVPVSTAVLNW